MAELLHEEVLDQVNHTSDHSRIVAIAVNSSSHSRYAFEWALSNLVKADGDQVVLLNVRPLVSLPIPSAVGLIPHTEFVGSADWLAKVEDGGRNASHALLKEFGAEARRRGVASVRAIAVRGDPRDEIVAKVKELNCSCLVLGSRGMGTLQRALLGSVSDFCIHNVHCPVLVTKQP